MKSTDKSFLEVVLYTVREPVTFLDRVRRVEAALRPKASGMRWWTHWVKPGDTTERAEVVAWATPAEAYRAAEVMITDPELKFFVDHITDIKHMSHYWADVAPLVFYEQLSGGGLLELALFESTDAETTVGCQPELHRALTRQAGLLHHHPLRDDRHDRRFGDLALWQSAEAHHVAGRTLPQAPQLAPYFSHIDRMLGFDLFEPAYHSR